MLWVTFKGTAIDSLVPLSLIPGLCLFLEIPLSSSALSVADFYLFSCPYGHPSCSEVPTSDPETLILLPIPSFTQFPPSTCLLWLILFLLLSEIQASSTVPYFLFNFLVSYLCSIEWVSYILWLISTYKWVYTMHTILEQGYLPQNDILKILQFNCKIHDVFVVIAE